MPELETMLEVELETMLEVELAEVRALGAGRGLVEGSAEVGLVPLERGQAFPPASISSSSGGDAQAWVLSWRCRRAGPGDPGPWRGAAWAGA